MSEFECGSTWCCCGECQLDGDLVYQKPDYADSLAKLTCWYGVLNEH